MEKVDRNLRRWASRNAYSLAYFFILFLITWGLLVYEVNK